MASSKVISTRGRHGARRRRSEPRARRRPAPPQADRLPRARSPTPGRRDLRLYSFLASLDVELLVARGAVAEVHAGYVGFEQLGFAPAFGRAVASGEIARLRVQRAPLRLGPAGLAAPGCRFSRRAGRGAPTSSPSSESRRSTCPYTGERLLAAPAIRPDVCVIHAEAADEQGNVLAPVDPRLPLRLRRDARPRRRGGDRDGGADRPLRRDPQRAAPCSSPSRSTPSWSCPRGAWPTALPGVYGADIEAVRTYLAAAEDDAERGGRDAGRSAAVTVDRRRADRVVARALLPAGRRPRRRRRDAAGRGGGPARPRAPRPGPAADRGGGGRRARRTTCRRRWCARR